MKLLSMAVAGATLLGTVAVGTVGASAQGIGVGVGPGGVSVGVDDGYRGRGYHRDRDWRDSRAYYREREDRVVVKKKRYNPDGSVTTITRERY